MSDDAPKSAYEIAMERLRKKDSETGVVEQPLTGAQKKAIAKARAVCEAKLAELEILHKSKLAAAATPEALETLENNYRRDVERARGDCERQIAKIRRGE